MTTANDAHRSQPIATEAPPSTNGAASLRDRVRSLRLSERAPENHRSSMAVLLLPWGLCVILLGVSVAFGYYAYAIAPTRTSADGNAQMADATDKGSKTLSPSSGDVASSGDVVLEAKGYIIPVHTIQVSPKVSGMLVDIHPRLEEGARFKLGEVLAKIEDVNYKSDYEHAKAALANAEQHYQQSLNNRPEEIDQARADLAESQSNLEQLKLEMQRSARLVGTPALSQKDYEQDKFAYEAMVRHADKLKASLRLMELGPRKEVQAAAKADMEAARADVAKAAWVLDNCEIKAPASGTILTKNAEKGNIVSPTAFSTAGGISASLCNMADLSDLEVDLKVQERDIARVAKGQPCIAMPEAYQNDPTFLKIHPQGYTGRVSRLMPSADRGQGAIPVRVKLDIPAEEEGVYLKPDMGVIVEFLKGVAK